MKKRYSPRDNNYLFLDSKDRHEPLYRIIRFKYLKDMFQTKKNSLNIKRRLIEDAEAELEEFKIQSEEQAREVENRANTNFEKAVNIVLSEILH